MEKIGGKQQSLYMTEMSRYVFGSHPNMKMHYKINFNWNEKRDDYEDDNDDDDDDDDDNDDRN